MYTYSDYEPQRVRRQRPQSSIYPSFLVSFFKPIVKFSKDFCLWTSMHGFNHIAWQRRHWFERLLWVVVTALAIWGAVDISLGQLQRYNENPTVVALEKDFRNWRYNLPGVTACEQNRVDPAKLPAMIKSLWNVTPEQAKYSYYSEFVHTVANSDLYHLGDFDKFQDDATLNVDMFKIAVELLPELSVKVSWSDEVDPPLPPNLPWTPVMTEAGACYTVNSLAIADIATVPLNPNETSLFPISCKYSPMFCFVMLEISTSNFSFYVHSNFDIVDITFSAYSVILSQISSSSLDVITTRDGRGVSDLAPTRRGCRYTAEPGPTRKVFSTNTCRLSCRSKLAVELCGCKPFYYFYEAEGEVCGVKGMACLATLASTLANNNGERCACAQPCVDAVFKEISTINKFWDKGMLMSRGSLRLVVQAPRTRYTREIIFHFQDLVVSFGGAAGLFLGASFISFVEIFYFILERFLSFCVGSAVGGQKPVNDEAQVKNTKIPYETLKIMELNKILDSQKKYDHGRHMKLYLNQTQ